jgi:hypothetical protein
MKKDQKQRVEKPEVMPKGGVAVAKRGATLPVKDVSVDERVHIVRNMLDTMENVQTAFAAGAVQVGMELLALKEQSPYGEFDKIFQDQIERPRFSRRTAAKYMQVAEQVRIKLLKSDQYRNQIADSWNVPPSAMTLSKRRELQTILGEILNGKTMSDLLMGERVIGGGGKGGSAPTTGKEAEQEAIRQSYEALAKQITREIVSQSRWKRLSTDELDHLRLALTTALDSINDRI